jgi:hypothetical protein
MQISRLSVIFLITSLLSACAEYREVEPLPPVFGGYPDRTGNDPYQNVPTNPVPQQPPVVITKPLENTNKPQVLTEIKPDLPPPTAVPPSAETDPLNPIGQPTETTDPFGAEQPTEPAENTGQPEAEQTPAAENMQPVPPPAPEPPKEPEELQPLETFAPQSPAVGSLVMAANENSEGGNLDSAVSSIERAIRIEPRNATLYYKLAVLRLKQSKPRLAEDIARKAALLAVNDNNLKKHSWLLVAKARELQSNVAGAEKAKAEAAKY